MSCKLYIRYYGADIRAGTFRNKKEAELFFKRNIASFKDKDGNYGTPIYVETGKGRGK